MNKSRSRLAGPKAGTSHDVVRALRTNILNGRWLPGSQLPPRLELLRSLKTTPVTLHHAVQRLVNDGFLRTAAGSGTFVSELPPHLNTYAVVFLYDPANWFDKQNWSRYFQALTQASSRLQQETGKRMLMFHGIDQHADSEDRMRLITHIERQRLAGVIFTNNPCGVSMSRKYPLLVGVVANNLSVKRWAGSDGLFHEAVEQQAT